MIGGGSATPWKGMKYTKVVIAEGITGLSKGLFYGEDQIEEVSFPSTMEEIGFYSFYGCGGLKSIVIPGTVKMINENAFALSGLQKVVISEGVSKIEEEAFFGCSDLSDLTLPDSIGYIWDRAFAGCALKSIRIPDGMWSIGKGVFGGNPIETIDTGTNTIFTAVDNVLYRYGNILLLYPAGKELP